MTRPALPLAVCFQPGSAQELESQRLPPNQPNNGQCILENRNALFIRTVMEGPVGLVLLGDVKRHLLVNPDMVPFMATLITAELDTLKGIPEHYCMQKEEILCRAWQERLAVAWTALCVCVCVLLTIKGKVNRLRLGMLPVSSLY